MPAGHLPSPPMEAARLFPEPAAGEPYTILIMVPCTVYKHSNAVTGFISSYRRVLAIFMDVFSDVEDHSEEKG
jgi:hypothetical protein